MGSLRAKAISGIFWSLLQNVGSKGISFIVMIILARLLTPEMFGLIGMLAIFMQLSQALVVAGFNEALIQKAHVDEEDYSSVFWLNLVLSMLIYAVLFATAPLIAQFYSKPELTILARALSLAFIINAFSYVQEARLRKKMQFKTLMVIHLPSMVLAAIVSIVMAIRGMGVWSLIAMELVSATAFSVQIWLYAGWKPLLVFNKVKIKRLFSFGSKLMLSGILRAVYSNIYLVLIGRFFTLGTVGYYQTANQLVKTPSSTLSNALNTVTFSAFATIQGNNARLKEGYKILTRQILFWICPLFVFSAVLAPSLFRLVLGEKWLPAVPFFRILCITGIFYPLSLYNINLIKVKGRSDITLYLSVAKRIITTIGIIIAIPFGIWALVGFQAINSIIAYLLNSYFSGRFVHYHVIDEIKDILPVLLLSMTTGLIVLLLDGFFSELTDWSRLAIGYGLGAGIYWVIAWSSRFPPYRDFISIAKKYRGIIAQPSKI